MRRTSTVRRCCCPWRRWTCLHAVTPLAPPAHTALHASELTACICLGLRRGSDEESDTRLPGSSGVLLDTISSLRKGEYAKRATPAPRTILG
eukprot:7380876-Prymnesium_polylepis.1